MNFAQRQVIAEKIASTVRVLELLGLEYEVTGPKNRREKGNRSPRIVHVKLSGDRWLRVYNGVGGSTWANRTDGRPIPGIRSIEDLYAYLSEQAQQSAARDRVKKRGA